MLFDPPASADLGVSTHLPTPTVIGTKAEVGRAAIAVLTEVGNTPPDANAPQPQPKPDTTRRSRSVDLRADLPARLAALETMDRAELITEWRRQFRSNPPDRIRRDLLELSIAWKWQEKAQGGLKKAVATELRDLAAALAETGDIKRVKPQKLKLGARLVREWGGATHEVTVVDGGFSWNGERWKSLSGIAEAITGAHWSGPRFFGLTSRKKSAGNENEGIADA